MNAAKTIRQKNVKNISTNSVSDDTLSMEQTELIAAERKLARLEKSLAKAREEIALLRQTLAEARALRKEKVTTQTTRSVEKAIGKLEDARHKAGQILTQYRELKLIVRDQRALVKKLEKKEAAKQRAVARFLREWERDYDREMRIKEDTVRKRKRFIAP